MHRILLDIKQIVKCISSKRLIFEDCLKLWFLAVLLILSYLISTGMRQFHAATLQQGIQSEVLRFHVLANSDSEADQQVKLKVRDGVLQWLDEQLTEEEQGNLERMEQRIEQLLPQIEGQADQILCEQGMTYRAAAKLGRSRFPAKTYGTCTFPAGNYTALRITLGEAKGHNWWCVLFPRLCFMDCVEAVLPEESQSELQNVLTEEEYESLFDPNEDTCKIEFRYF